MTTSSEKEDFSENDVDSFTLPETVLCVDTICHICCAEFLHEEDLKLHLERQHATEQTRCCRFCSYQYPNLEEYASHIINVHILDLKCCKYCLRLFTQVKDVKEHEKKHISSDSSFELSCSNCKLTFKSISSLEDHEFLMHSDIKDGVLLRDCYPFLSSYLNMNAHKFLKSLGDKQEYRCINCDFFTQNIKYYIQHTKQKRCSCLVCDKCYHVFKDVEMLKEHYNNNSCSTEDLNLPCKKCFKMFTYEEMVNHTEECKALICHSCNSVFDTVEKRAEHQSVSHPMMFSIKECKYCHQEYVGEEALEKHLKRTHDKKLHLFKYFCTYCEDIMFDHPKKLFNHFFRKHSNLEPFTCKICKVNFRSRKNFTLHIKLNHLSVGNVKFDNKYHVIFEQNNFTTKDKSNNNKNTINNEKTDDIEADKSSELLEEVKDWKRKKIIMYPTENETDQSDLTDKRGKVMQGDSEVDLVLCTDKETNEPEAQKERRMMKRKRKIKYAHSKEYVDLAIDDSEVSDDEPLIRKSKRGKTRANNSIPTWLEKSKLLQRNKEKFTCKICKKYCYTYQNYEHHMTLHKKNLYKKCIKCPKVFKTTEQLNQHITKKHSTSKLTETLKNVLERRKQIKNPTEINPIKIDRKHISEKFAKTIKKVNVNSTDTSVNIKPVIDKLSVRKFIENFTPESNGINCKGNTIFINNSLTIKPIIAPNKPPFIKLIKSELNELIFTKLKQPERFKSKNNGTYSVSIKIADPDARPKMNFDPTEEILDKAFEESNDDSMDRVPEVAEEVMLDDTIESKTTDTQNDLSNVFDYSLAHLTQQSPYYKIVKVRDVVTNMPINESQEKQIKLPDGTKFVNVNPLAHLLEGKNIVLKRNKYYKPKLSDIAKAVESALTKTAPKRKPRASKLKKTEVVNEQ